MTSPRRPSDALIAAIVAIGMSGCLSTDWCKNVDCAFAGTVCDPETAECVCDPDQCPGNYGCQIPGSSSDVSCASDCFEDEQCKDGFQCERNASFEYSCR
jgi:hypothetical protein